MSNILVGDDQAYLQALSSQELIEEGYGTVSVGDGQLAKGCLEDSKPDLVLLDLYLGGFEGWDQGTLPSIHREALCLLNFAEVAELRCTL
jgi:DNA-binding response OmpR family regulator